MPKPGESLALMLCMTFFIMLSVSTNCDILWHISITWVVSINVGHLTLHIYISCYMYTLYNCTWLYITWSKWDALINVGNLHYWCRKLYSNKILFCVSGTQGRAPWYRREALQPAENPRRIPTSSPPVGEESTASTERLQGPDSGWWFRHHYAGDSQERGYWHFSQGDNMFGILLQVLIWISDIVILILKNENIAIL